MPRHARGIFFLRIAKIADFRYNMKHHPLQFWEVRYG